MKAIIAFLALVSMSSSAFAIHAYGTDDCITKMINGATLEIDLENGQPAGSHKIVNEPSFELTYVNYDRVVNGSDANPKDAALVLINTKDANKVSQKTDDGCFQGTQRTFTRTNVVDAVTPEVAQFYGLKKGMKLNFVCRSSFSAPTGDHCN